MAVILTGCGVTAPAAEPAPQPVEPSSEVELDGAVGVTVERVIDGDSLELTIDAESVEVRLLDINAPELRSSDGDDTCAGSSARGQLESSIDAAVTVAFVPDELDRFGRRLGVLVLDDRPVTEMMVEAGWALALWSGENEALSDLMIEAADDRRGMWGSACGEPATADLVISDVRADAPGDDRENLTEEWVTVTNDGLGPVDLHGWIIRDEYDQQPLHHRRTGLGGWGVGAVPLRAGQLERRRLLPWRDVPRVVEPRRDRAARRPRRCDRIPRICVALTSSPGNPRK